MKLHELQNYNHWEKVLIIHILLEAPIVVSLILLSLPLAGQDDTLHYKQRQLSIQKLRYQKSQTWLPKTSLINFLSQTCGFIFLGSSHLGFNFFDPLNDAHFRWVLAVIVKREKQNERNVSFCRLSLRSKNPTIIKLEEAGNLAIIQQSQLI